MAKVRDEVPTPKTPMSNKKYLSIWIPVLTLVTALVVFLNVALVVAEGWVASQLGSGTYTVTNSAEAANWDTNYYKTDFATLEDAEKLAKQLVADIGTEGMVLAKNESQALPLPPGAAVTMLGRAAANPIYGGSGSGSIDVTTAITARQGLELAGFQVNDAVFQMIADFAAANPRGYIEMDKPDISTYNIGELPVANYQAVAGTFADYAAAALIFIGRPGGEGGDLTQDMQGWDDSYQPGQHQLQLNRDEQDLIDLATEHFETVIVIVNASTTLELKAVQNNPKVSGIILAGSPGLTGFTGLGRILSGEANPSGRTVDTWAADFSADPTFSNFGDFIYQNISVSYPTLAVEALLTNAEITPEAPFVNYAEGIYVGYRYYETAAAEGFIDYNSAVVYPFGYGLSYTDFTWNLVNQEFGDTDGIISLYVEVTNNGAVAGKDVVEAYYSAPYTPGGIEKAEVVLGAFAKTGVIEPGASAQVTLEFPVQDMASYDYKTRQAYVLEAGDYSISLRTDSHTIAAGTVALNYPVAADVVYDAGNPRASDAVAAVNRFDDLNEAFTYGSKANGKILEMSRSDFAGTFPTAPTADLFVASESVAAGFAPWDTAAAATAYQGESPTTDADTGLALIDLRGLAKDDPKWETLLSSLSVNDMTTMLLNGAYQTSGILSVGKPSTIEPDGPAGFSSFINADIKGIAYPSEYLLAQTWSVELLQRMGVALGNEALFKGINGWYAPAMNTHRSPFAGRNFEYYSEDPLLSGTLGAAVSNGAATKGVYTFFKHFALNEQEANRVNNGIATWATEQALREIYLKPFEIAVKNVTMEVPYLADNSGIITTTTVGASAVMSSFNRIGAVWAGGSKALMTDVLRGEWGFDGFVISDFNLYPYMNPNQSIHAGTDLTLTFAPSKSFNDVTSLKALSDLRRATHNILFTVVNSNAMNGMAPGAVVNYTPPVWVYIQIAATVVLGAVLLTGAVFITRRVIRHRKLA
ncbi:MAG: glycoside hydrolase family 3 C-terminal domain-containing protein [Propionibacteriaceae bacterium]|jgi:beta-glucosidase|nr:glycoside hydrolase family 3 C-terminal domain-containing protein [Propionibacteriaceae bacterium]